MRYTPHYPRTVAEVLDDDMKFNPDVLRAVKAYRAAKPWRGSEDEKRAKLRVFHRALCRIYGRSTALVLVGEAALACAGIFEPALDRITLGKVSVVTYLHEFGHVLGKDERETCRWSINLFRRIFPRSYANCDHAGYMLVKGLPRLPAPDQTIRATTVARPALPAHTHH